MIPDAVRHRLNYVRVSDPSLIVEQFPDFLIVGPQRTGTTWLHAHLRFHPQIFLSEPKELFFFSRLKSPADPRFQSNELSWYLQFFHDPLWRRAAKTVICLWKYRELYRPLIRGEATASYAALDRDVIEEIVVLNPDIKVVLMIRDPVDRAWSHAKKDLVRNRKRRFEDVTAAEFREFFADRYQRQCARYVENCDNWSACVRPGHLFLGLFDDIGTRPEGLLLEVMSFLGVSSDRRYLAASVRESVNPTAPSPIPDEHREHLERLLAPDIAQLRQQLGFAWESGVLRRLKRGA